MCSEIGSVRPLLALILIAAGAPVGAQTVPMPRPRPAVAVRPPAQLLPSDHSTEPSACRLRLTDELAIAPSIPPLTGPGACAVADVVKLEAVVMPDKSRVAISPPATLRCGMAEAIAHWVREDLAEAVQQFGAPLKSIDNYASYDCRGRNNIPGAQLSEHGKANALDIRLFRLTDGKVLRLTDPAVSHAFREGLKKSVCGRFSTILGPGSDGYHEDHVHVDLMERAPGRFRMCQWAIHDPEPAHGEAAAVGPAARVPLPPPRPNFEPASASSRPKI